MVNRGRFQGILNIIRFNWHFYLLAGLFILIGLILAQFLESRFVFLAYMAISLIAGTILISLVVSYFIYDYSPLYKLEHLPSLDNKKVLNINAGFDEISEIIKSKHNTTSLINADFYDPKVHTEISIKRARKAYPPSSDTIKIQRTSLPFESNNFDYVIIFLAAHEIRNEEERENFFTELKRILKPSGNIIITEHLRDTPNFLAYNLGFFHFHSMSSWKSTFKKAGLKIEKETKTTIFIHNFNLAKVP